MNKQVNVAELKQRAQVLESKLKAVQEAKKKGEWKPGFEKREQAVRRAKKTYEKANGNPGVKNKDFHVYEKDGRFHIGDGKGSKKVEESISYLIESEMEKAEVIMVAKSVVEKLQKTAEELAKIEGSDIMPAMEALKAAFGIEQATAFQQSVSEQLRNAVNALTAAKDSIGQHVSGFEGSLEGTTTNDMASMGAEPAAPVAPAAPAPGADAGLDAGMDAGLDAGAEADPLAGDAETDTDMADLDGMFNDTGTDTAAGRARKESVAHNGAKALSESTDPDALILSKFRALIKEGHKPVPCAKAVARHFGIDFADVVAIVKEGAFGISRRGPSRNPAASPVVEPMSSETEAYNRRLYAQFDRTKPDLSAYMNPESGQFYSEKHRQDYERKIAEWEANKAAARGK